MVTTPPDEHLAFLIHVAAKRLRVEFARRAADYGLTPSRARAVAFLARQPGASLTALAEALEVQPMSVVRVVDDLESQGLARREPDPRDRRALRLSLTPAGEAAEAQVWQTLDGIIAEATADLSSAERAGLARGLKALVGGMDAFVTSASAAGEGR